MVGPADGAKHFLLCCSLSSGGNAQDTFLSPLCWQRCESGKRAVADFCVAETGTARASHHLSLASPKVCHPLCPLVYQWQKGQRGPCSSARFCGLVVTHRALHTCSTQRSKHPPPCARDCGFKVRKGQMHQGLCKWLKLLPILVSPTPDSWISDAASVLTPVSGWT